MKSVFSDNVQLQSVTPRAIVLRSLCTAVNRLVDVSMGKLGFHCLTGDRHRLKDFDRSDLPDHFNFFFSCHSSQLKCQNHGFFIQNKLSKQRKWVYFCQICFKKMKNLALSWDINNTLTSRLIKYVNICRTTLVPALWT